MSYTQAPPPPTAAELAASNNLRRRVPLVRTAPLPYGMELHQPGVFSKVADGLQRLTVVGLIGLTAWGCYQFGSAFYAIRERREKWEAENPEEAAAMAIKMAEEREKARMRKGY